MSGDSPPPKPKVGSLRDRIAAFESKPQAAPAPVPRPKPGGHVQWKPKPPSSPPASSGTDAKADEGSSSSDKKPVKSGMSAQDAKESIGMGGSLKERMAALQSKNTFGAPAPAPPPKPASDKPKWKPPPPPVSPPAGEEDGPQIGGTDHEVKGPPTDVVEGQEEASQAPEENAEPDEEEEERQRRAAIAARLARLGGTRVGMGPPVFGMKPPVKKPEKKESVEEVISGHEVV
ncbi:hypothetical protein SCHPADRAFT_603771 [Schizopora paradoxa]|uniref:Uncharacterized protein n=1 Tax=Schizopora paradoxa TaxID=27342 RepID=A0A0H2R9L9_9AGAM|nr:hypothetical protein SCHPADRAFT_603771 [Schizopora paradoxa]